MAEKETKIEQEKLSKEDKKKFNEMAKWLIELMEGDEEKGRFEELLRYIRHDILVLCENIDEYTQMSADRQSIIKLDEMLDIYNALQHQIVNQMDSIDKLLRKIEKLEQDLINIKEQRDFYQKENSELHVKADFLETEKEGFRKENEQLKAEILLQNHVIENFNTDNDNNTDGDPIDI